MANLLNQAQIATVATTLTKGLKEMNVEFGIMGGAGVSLLTSQYDRDLSFRETADVDLIIKPDPARSITAEKISQRLLKDYPSLFEGIDQYGVTIPALRFQKDGRKVLVEIEIFDVEAWPQRPQYDLTKKDNSRVQLSIGGETVPVMSPAWILREKLSSQMGREGSKKEATDIDDIVILVDLLDEKELKIEGSHMLEALKRFLTKRPDMRPILERVIDCKEVFPS